MADDALTEEVEGPRSPLLERSGAVEGTGPDAGVAWHYGDPVGEQRALGRGAAFVDLSHVGVVRVSGADRLTWLNSITSQLLLDLPPGVSTETLVLSPQGRVEHTAGVVDDGEATWLVTESAASLAAWLDRMRFMTPVEVTDVSDAFAVLGEPVRGTSAPEAAFVWEDPWPATRDGGTRYGPSDEEHPGRERSWRLVTVPRAGLSDAVATREAAGQRLAGTWASEALRIAAWRPRAALDVDAKTIAHELDWLRTAVHLHKGCYRGQETIARVHNLGRPPRRLVQLHLDGSDVVLPEPGASVYRGERTVGHITSVVRHYEDGPIALALVKRSLPLDAELDVLADEIRVAAAQEEIVATEGLSPDRPEPRGPLTRGLRPRA